MYLSTNNVCLDRGVGGHRDGMMYIVMNKYTVQGVWSLCWGDHYFVSLFPALLFFIHNTPREEQLLYWLNNLAQLSIAQWLCTDSSGSVGLQTL